MTKTSLKSRSKISCHYFQQLASSGVQRRGFMMGKVCLLRILSLAVKKILCFVNRSSLYNLANKSNQVHNSAQYIYFSSLHVSDNHVPIIKRQLLYLCDTGVCHSIWVASGLLVGVSQYIYFSSLHVSDNYVPIIRRQLLYLCDTGVCHSVWVASGLLV